VPPQSLPRAAAGHAAAAVLPVAYAVMLGRADPGPPAHPERRAPTCPPVPRLDLVPKDVVTLG
jgi:hypothetical protein